MFGRVICMSCVLLLGQVRLNVALRDVYSHNLSHIKAVVVVTVTVTATVTATTMVMVTAMGSPQHRDHPRDMAQTC